MLFGEIDRLLVFGGQPYCVKIAELAREKGFEVWVLASTRNVDGVKIDGLAWHEKLAELNIPFVVTDEIDSPEVHELVTEKTLGLSHGAPWIFRQNFIQQFSGRLLNFHPSRLPLYRGGGGHSWRILRGDRQGAFTIHFIDEGIDTGDILVTSPFVYPDECRVPDDFFSWEREAGLGFLGDFFSMILQQQEFAPRGQQEMFSTYFPRLNTLIHAAIDWSWTVDELDRFICAFDDPYPGAFTFAGNRKVRLKGCRILEQGLCYHPFQRGLVIRSDSHGVYVACRDGELLVGRVLDEDTGDEISLALGSRFHTPGLELDQAMSSRVVYTPQGLKEFK